MPKLTTTVYKYKRYAVWMLIGLAIGTVLTFILSPYLPPMMSVICIVGLFVILIIAAIRPKSIFSLRSVDNRKLVFTPEELSWGNWLIPVRELEKLEIYIHGFDTFRYFTGHYKGRPSFTSTYGDRNTIRFVYRSIPYDLTFFLGTFEHYDTLIQIMESWRNNGIIFSARSLFTDEYIRDQVNRYAQYPHN